MFTISPTIWILAGTAVSLILSVGFGEIAGRLGDTPSTGLVIGFVVAWLGSYVIPAFLLTYVNYNSFRRSSRRQLLAIILVSYFSMLLVFGGLYYSMVVVGDHNDAVTEYHYYRALADGVARGVDKKAYPYNHQLRAFRGMRSKLWASVEENVPWTVWKDSQYPPQLDHWLQESQMRSLDQIVKFQPGVRLPILLDCLHLSVITMTTVGFGDIVPNVWYSKIAVDIQAITGLVLFVVALGMLFGNWWHGRE